MKKTFLFHLVFLKVFCAFTLCAAQAETKKFTLEEVIKLAAEQSPDALSAKNQYYNSYWQYKIYQTDFLPRLSFDGNSNINRAINPITLPTGEAIFVQQHLTTSAANLTLAQNIGLSGTQIFINSGVQRIDITSDPVSRSYLSTPVRVGFQQPVLSYNPLRWQRKIEPLKFTEAKRQYLESMEGLSQKAVSAFFDLFLAQINMEIALKNKSNNDTLIKIARGRYNLGKIAENELLQIELEALNANTSVTQANLDVKISMFNLKKFLGIRDNSEISLVTPAPPPALKINFNIALEQALKNRMKVTQLERELVEAARDVAQAKGESRFKMNLTGSYGLTKSDPVLKQTYINPLEQQQLNLGVTMPIIDWGRAGAQVKMKEASQELIKTTVEQERINFEQEIFLTATQYEIQNDQYQIATKADTIGIKRFEVAKQRYYIGKIDVTGLQIAQREKDLSTRSYVEALRNYWNLFYSVRRLTLFDFSKNTIIERNLKPGK